LPELEKRADIDPARGVFLDHEFVRRAREDIGTANDERAKMLPPSFVIRISSFI
jgi:hypothetical protein